MSELLKLAERCEAATGPDRELDAVIGTALGNLVAGRFALRYTASIDAAMTLVPERCHWGMGFDSGGKGWAWVAYRSEGRWQTTPSIWATTPALALCAASLRALAAQEPSS